jgi:hypothetical protein
MAASNTSGPDEPGDLSAREKKILEGIEDDILTADPNLARRMTRAARSTPGARWRATARHGALLLAALIILIIAAAVLPPTWLVGCPRPPHRAPARPVDPALPHPPLPQRLSTTRMQSGCDAHSANQGKAPNRAPDGHDSNRLLKARVRGERAA